MLEKTLESPLDSFGSFGHSNQSRKRNKRNPNWKRSGRADTKAEVSILWPPDVKSWLVGKDLDVGKD